MARLLAITLAFTALTAGPVEASRRSNGIGHGPGPCMGIATPTEQALMAHESHGWPTADNPTSTAYGCGQLLAGHRARFAKRCATTPNTTNPTASLCLMRAYITDRYGTADKALRFRRARGWY